MESRVLNDYYVYVMTNWNNKVMYIGVTNNLPRRVYEHRNGIVEGFTKRYNVHKLVYYEAFHDVNDAIACEKKLKGHRNTDECTVSQQHYPER